MKSVLKLAIALLAIHPTQAQQDILSSSNLPIFVIDTYGQGIPNEPKIDAHLGIIHQKNGNPNLIDDPFTEYDGSIGIEIRGNGTVGFDKVSYQFETRLPTGDNNNTSLLILPEENDWILYGPYIDKSLMRNVLMYELAREMGYYAARTQFCELVLNDEYWGVYILMEKIKRDKNRVKITKFKEDNQLPSEGGFIVKIDSWWTAERGWKSPAFEVDSQERISRYQYVYPKYDDISDPQKAYIENHITNFEQALYEAETPNIYQAYAPYIDINSFADYFLLTEFSRNPDGYRLSTFMHKDADNVDGRLKMGPVWDYNFSFGNYFYTQNDTEGWEYDNDWWVESSRIPFWWEKLLQDDFFVETLIQRWRFWRTEIINCERIESKIDDWSTEIDDAQVRNFTRWDILGENIDLDWNTGDTYVGELNYLKSWTCDRIEWMDTALEKLEKQFPGCTLLVYPNPSQGNFNIEFQSTKTSQSQLQIFDTLGRLLYQQTVDTQQGNNRIEITNLNLAKGIYTISLIDKDFCGSERIFIGKE